jgi:peptide/nickel transport system substrate-binding protein
VHSNIYIAVSASFADVKMKYRRTVGIGFLIATVLALQLFANIAPTVAQEEKSVWRRPFSYNPPPVGHFNFYYGAIGVADWVCDLLTHYYMENGTYVPCLAESWKIDPNYLWFWVKLRQGVKYHDGHELTVKDVLASFYTGPYLQKDRLWYYIKDIKVVDNYTLNFTFTERTDYPVFYILWHWTIISYTQYGTFSERVQEKIRQGYNIFNNPEQFQPIIDDLKAYRPETMIGCGPYKIKSVSDTMIVLEAFDDYWNGRPPVDEIQLIRYASSDVMWNDILNGDLDYVWAISPAPEIVEQLKTKPHVWMTVISRPIGVLLYINTKVYPLSELNVRRAIAYAINRSETAAVQYPGGNVVSQYVIGWHRTDLTTYLNQSFIDKYLKDFKYEYNPAKAEQLLQELGFRKGSDGVYVTPNGTRLEFELSFGAYIDAKGAENVAAQLAKVGIKVTVRQYDSAVYDAPDGPLTMGRFQLGIRAYGSPSFSYDEIYHKYMALFPGHGLGQIQRVPWKTEPVNVTYLAKRIPLFPAQITQAELTEIYSTLAYVTGDQLPVINLYSPGVVIYMNKEKFVFPTSQIYWAGLGSYELHGLRPLFAFGWLKPKLRLTIGMEPEGGGALTPAPGSYGYGKGTSVAVTAAPASGYTFKKWVLDGVDAGTSTTITVTMDKSHTLRAVFERVPYELYVAIVLIVVVVAVVAYYMLRKRKSR